MAEDLKNILSNLNKDVDQETLLKYLNHQLDAEELHEVEQQMIDNSFESDAIEGLQQLEDTRRLMLITEALNRDLKKKTQKKRAARAKRNIQPQWWLYISIIIFLILIALIYLYLHKSINA